MISGWVFQVDGALTVRSHSMGYITEGHLPYDSGHFEILSREGGDIELFITLVPKVLKGCFGLRTLGTFIEF